MKTLKMVVPPPFSELSEFSPGIAAEDPTLKTLKMVGPPPFSEFSPLGGGQSCENVEKGGLTTIFKVFRVGSSAGMPGLNSESFEN